MRLISCLLLATLLLLAHQPGRAEGYYPMLPRLQKADYIFFHNRVFTPASTPAEQQSRREQLDTIKRFKICLTNGYTNFAGEDLRELQAAGCELFIYRWFNGYYEDELQNTTASQQTYYKNYPEMVELFRSIHAHPEWLLNPGKPMQGAGAVHPAYFFDFSNPEFRAFYVESIRRDLERTGYNGVFFDYIGGWALPADVNALWKTKYAGKTYDDYGIEFIKELRAALGAKRIFGNQAYRLPEAYYDYIDYDATESHAVSFVWGKEAELYLKGQGTQKTLDTFVRLWDGPGGYKEISAERRAMHKKKPRVKVCDTNYLQAWRVPTGATAEVGDLRRPVFIERRDRPSIFYSYAVSKLEDGAVYASDWYCTTGAGDDVYFLDLGKPLDPDYIESPEAVVRYFENGFVLITRSNGHVEFAPDPAKRPAGKPGLWDVYEAARVEGGAAAKVQVYPAYYPSTQSYYPSGRVFMYLP